MGKEILQHELNYTQQQWSQWLELLKIYLAMGEWIHDARPKKEVCRSKGAILVVIKGIQHFFPRSNYSHGYNLPKMHALAKMPDYICEFGTGMNFYSGPVEASHKRL